MTFNEVWKELEKEDEAFITARKQSEEIVKFINENCRECNEVDREMYENCEQCYFLKTFLENKGDNND